MNDYERIARIIRYLDEHQAAQPGLATLAEVAGLSPHHVHRLFSKWAAVTPKDFLQCLTLSHARSLLAAGENVLNTALEVGLSGPGCLHDLCVNLETATPGEIKRGGAGWTITCGFAESPFGTVLIGQHLRGLCHLSFVDEAHDTAMKALQSDWPQAELKRDDASAAQLADRIFTRKGADTPPLRACVRGTPFQLRVWRALMAIPPGTLTTYGTLAASLGQPAAARAVGTAIGRNHLGYLIPCHRVIRETGLLGGYRWGLIRKQAIIARESLHHQQEPHP
ncbi:MAG: AraC family transcriptional regulator of adaptative response [Kiritimatiellia bacterium]|jgi:AraC family transcriptional regulator of adaptative response/methylated-DNA-[protein]-cysteine methyltransferase